MHEAQKNAVMLRALPNVTIGGPAAEVWKGWDSLLKISDAYYEILKQTGHPCWKMQKLLAKHKQKEGAKEKEERPTNATRATKRDHSF